MLRGDKVRTVSALLKVGTFGINNGEFACTKVCWGGQAGYRDKCNCLCGGMNHGVGEESAIANIRSHADELISFAVENLTRLQQQSARGWYATFDPKVTGESEHVSIVVDRHGTARTQRGHIFAFPGQGHGWEPEELFADAGIPLGRRRRR